MTSDERQFHLRQFELAVDAVWKSQEIVDRHVRFFFVAVFAAVGGVAWLASRPLAAGASLLLLMLGLYTLDVVVKRALASTAAMRTVELLCTRLGDARLAGESHRLSYPFANEGVRRLVMMTNTLLFAAVTSLGLSEVLRGLEGPWPTAVSGVLALQVAAGAWFFQGRMTKRLENAAESAAHAAIAGSTAAAPWWTAPPPAAAVRDNEGSADRN